VNFWDVALHYSGLLKKHQEIDKKTDAFLKELTDKKADLDFLQKEIFSLREGLKEMPDKTQNGYFRDLLTKYSSQEHLLNWQLAQLDQDYQQEMRRLTFKDSRETDQSIAQNQRQGSNDLRQANQQQAQNQLQELNDLRQANQQQAQNQMQRINDLEQSQMNRGTNQQNAQEQMQRLNDLMEQNREHLQSLIERTNDLLQQNQDRLQYFRTN